jgi:3-hydroxyacyl-CoA dehydrogenase
MSEVVSVRRDGDIAVIVIDNPPVNALRHAVRAGVKSALEQLRDDASVTAIALTCAGRTFVAGADITEFGKPMQPPGLGEVIVTLEAMPKPVVAAIHGTALGGGLELALGCHFRVAVPTARLGLPEIKLGIIPGAGGTQRLPRLIGMEKAMPMILSGDPIPAREAHALGLVDEIADGELTAAAVAFARKAVADKRGLPRIRDRDEKLKPLKDNPAKFDELVATHTKRSRGLHAPAGAIEAMRAAVELPMDEGLKREREVFSRLVSGEQSRAQRHAFFAEREAAKVPDIPASVKPREIRTAAVIGAGTMGGGIAMCFANAGIPVTVVETSDEALQRGLATVRKNYENSAKRGGLSGEDVERRVGLLSGTTDFGKIADADIVIEAVFEEMPIKKEVFGKLDAIAKPDAVLATNTSYLNVNEIGQATKRPGSVVGMHFFSPANVMKLLEIVRGEATAPDVLATAIAVGRKIGKVPAIVGVCHGFVGNRMLRARGIEAERLLLEGALPQDVDAAIVEFGFPMGPLAMGDLAGLDVGWRVRKASNLKAPIADAICEMGRYGQKTGRGYYIYQSGSRTPQPDPEIEHLIVQTSQRMGVTRRQIDKKEIVERLIFPMINEGARILEEGIARRPGDIDVIWIYGYGWPVWRGGPMFYADQVGLPYIRDRLAHYAAQSKDDRLQPAALLSRLAAEGRGFGTMAEEKKAVA